jgi:hypothetical protein
MTKCKKEPVAQTAPTAGWFVKAIAGAVIATACVWAGQWIARVESGITQNASAGIQQKELHSALDTRLFEVYASLQRIESKLDKAVEREIARSKE